VTTSHARAPPSGGHSSNIYMGYTMTNKQPPKHDEAKSDALDRELDKALEDTFPASDPVAVDSAAAHEERHRKPQQEKK
jgi:hypothetical protein